MCIAACLVSRLQVILLFHWYTCLSSYPPHMAHSALRIRMLSNLARDHLVIWSILIFPLLLFASWMQASHMAHGQLNVVYTLCTWTSSLVVPHCQPTNFLYRLNNAFECSLTATKSVWPDSLLLPPKNEFRWNFESDWIPWNIKRWTGIRLLECFTLNSAKQIHGWPQYNNYRLMMVDQMVYTTTTTKRPTSSVNFEIFRGTRSPSNFLPQMPVVKKRKKNSHSFTLTGR